MKAYGCISGYCLANSPQAITFCQLIGSKRWRLGNRAGKTILVEQGRVYRSRWFSVIAFHQTENNRKVTIAIAFDAMDKQNYNQLLAKLWEP